jgi:hypothetical protein
MYNRITTSIVISLSLVEPSAISTGPTPKKVIKINAIPNKT